MTKYSMRVTKKMMIFGHKTYYLAIVFPVQPGLEAWHTVFYVTSGLLFFEFILFTIFGSSVEQSWNTPKDGGDYEMPAAVYH